MKASFRFVNVLAVLAVVLALAGVASGQSSTVYYACQNKDGPLFMKPGAGMCDKNQTEISWNQQGPKGDQGPAGNTVLNGEGRPGNSVGAAGDFYIDTAAYLIYGPKTATEGWPLFGTSLVGPAGEPGAGDIGGTNTILNGSGAPTDNTVGTDGDFYIDTTAHIIYGPKANGTWPAAGTRLVGPQGPAGVNGMNGNTILSGPGAPATQGGADIGVKGDFYIDTTAHVIYGPKSYDGWPTTGTPLVADVTALQAQVDALQTQLDTLQAKTNAALGKKVFVSSAVYTGALGGLAGADTKCQTLANAAGLSGTFKAWLSDSHTSAAARLTHGSFAYMLVDGTKVTDDWADLTAPVPQFSIVLDHAINVDEHGTVLSAPPDTAWTNTTPSGLAANVNNCADWTSADWEATGYIGEPSKVYTSWTYFGAAGWCNNAYHLYCFQQ